MSQKLCATPKSGAYDFYSFETVDLVKVSPKIHQIHSFGGKKFYATHFEAAKNF
jgi:hypothetical protein